MERLAVRVILLWGWRRWLAAMVAGALASLALAPFDFPAAGFIAFPILVWLLDGAVSSGATFRRFLPFFSTGWWFGFGYFLAGSGWVATTFATAGHRIALPFAVIGLSAALALFYGLAALIARLLWSDGLGRVAALAFALGTAEWLRVILFPGLAWNAIGCAIMPLPIFMQAVQIVGMTGMSAAAVFIFSAPALVGTRRHMAAGLSLAAVLIALQVGYGYFRLVTVPAPEDFVRVRLVQPADLARGGVEEAVQAYLALSAGEGAANPPSLILWPEGAIPIVLTERGDILSELERAVGDGQVLVAGTMRRAGTGAEASSELYDAVAVINSGGEITDAADKQSFYPLATYRLFRWVAEAIGPQVGWAHASTAERSRHILQIAGGMRAIPLIGSEILRSDARHRETEDVDVIVNPAGHASLAGPLAPYQHLRRAQILAVEADLPLLVAASSGISASIDSRGRVLDALGPGAYGALDILLPLAERKSAASGNYLPGGLIFAAIFGMLALLLKMRERLI